jgi:hypothetical protein
MSVRFNQFCFLIAFIILSTPGVAAERSLEILAGTALNIRTPLHIQQTGNPDIDTQAEYISKPFQLPPYYNIRYSQELQEGRLEFQFIHHKLYLNNPPAEVQSFEITHGFNIFTANRVLERKDWLWRAGLGFVLAHTESQIRNQVMPSGGGLLGSGYRIAGPVLISGVGRQLPISRRWFVNAELQAIASYVEVPIARGEASLTHYSIHAQFGLGYHL